MDAVDRYPVQSRSDCPEPIVDDILYVVGDALEFAGQRLRHAFIGIKGRNPRAGGLLKSDLSNRFDVRQPLVVKQLRSITLGNLARAIGAGHVHDHDFADPARNAQRARFDNLGLVARHHHG